MPPDPPPGRCVGFRIGWLTPATSASNLALLNGSKSCLTPQVMKKVLIAGFSAAGLLALVSPAQAARIVFTAPTSQAFTVSNTATGQGSVNVTTKISTTGGTNWFSGATGLTDAFDRPDVQGFSWRTVATTPTTTVGGSRPVQIRFNQFTLNGSCSICGQVLVPSANGYLLGGIFPGEGIASNTGVTNGATIRAGSLYGGAPITFGIPGSSMTGNISFEAISGGGYTITLDAPDAVPAPLPLLGGASAFAFSRRLRRRIRLVQPS